MRLFPVLLILILAACEPRLPVAQVPEGTPEGRSTVVYVATNRSDFEGVPARGRAETSRHIRYRVRIPEAHVTGELAMPTYNPDPARHFMALDAVEFDSAAQFSRAIARDLARMEGENRAITIFIHGFNTTYAESLMRMAQLNNDLDLPGVSVQFSWPSANSPLGYAYDRDSTLYSRDSLERLLRSLPRTDKRLVIVAHSLGAHLTMETLRQIEIVDPGWSSRTLGGVILVSPDIDVEVFRSQVARMSPLPQPFLIFVSSRDPALGLSALISGDSGRLGNVTDPSELADLEITLLDVSAFGAGHFTFGESPALIPILRRIARFDTSFRDEGRRPTGLVPGTVLTIRNVTEIVLSPLARYSQR